ncbi:MAG: response regulator [Proteobacteria bacterium]|nr:response regulator [Pseudomonadota bacterium]
MKYLVVDDEPLAVIRLVKLLENTGITNIITANNGQKALEIVEKHHPHVVFLDIKMPVLSGIQAAPKIKEISPETQIIFCTAYDDFAIKAFDLSATDYLLKPVSKERLNQALDKVSRPNEGDSFVFKNGNDLISLALDEIYCFVSEDKYTTMYCQLGQIIIDDSLLSLEAKFHNQLLRINRNALINTSELYGIRRSKSQAFAKLRSTEYQPQISRRNIRTIKQLIT